MWKIPDNITVSSFPLGNNALVSTLVSLYGVARCDVRNRTSLSCPLDTCIRVVGMGAHAPHTCTHARAHLVSLITLITRSGPKITPLFSEIVMF